MTGAEARPAIARAGVVLAVLQFAFALTWIVYAAFLVASGAAAHGMAAALPAVPPIAWAVGALVAGALAVRRYGT
jgi:hypothetical protein